MAPAPKPTRVSTTGNKYSSAPPVKSNPRIVGRYKVKPVKVPKGLVLKKRGGGKGYVTIRQPGATAPGAPGAPAATGTTTPKANTYPEYKDFPAAQRALADIDRDQAFGIAEAGKVGEWLKGALTGLTGVDPSQPGLNPAMQQQYLGNVRGIVGGAMGAATAGAMGPQVQATTPGGLAVSPTAYLSQAAMEGNVGRSSAMQQAAQVQSFLNTIQPNTQAQAYVRAYADMQAGLPQIYATRRSEARLKIDEFIEAARHNRVSEATSAWNAQTNAAIAAGRLGLDATKFGADQASDLAASSQPVPEGVIRLPDGSYRNDPTYQPPEAPEPPASAKPLTSSQISSMQGKWKRPKSSPPKLGPGWKQPVWDPGTKAWYAKRGPAGSASTPTTRRKVTELEQELVDLYKPGELGGWEDQFENNPAGAGKRMALWVRENKPDFTGKGRKADIAKLRAVLARVGGRPAKEAISILVRGYIDANGNWK